MANILSHAYKGSILSSLINISYEAPIDTIQQMVDSGLPFYVLGGTACVWVTTSDPRPSVKQLNARRFDMVTIWIHSLAILTDDIYICISSHGVVLQMKNI